MGQTKRQEEREFYLRLAAREGWSKRELLLHRFRVPRPGGRRRLRARSSLLPSGLNCLVAIELKVGRFEPEYLGKLGFYLEAIDRNVRKAHEQPAIGVLLCASKNDEVVEYALSRSLTPALIAEYHTQLPDKKLLQAKLHEFYVGSLSLASDL